MQKSQSQMIQRLINVLKDNIQGNIIDIFIIGSFLKNKLVPRDLDLIVFFKEKDLKDVEENLYEIKEKITFFKEVHIEPLFLENIFLEKITFSLFHEGFSIKKGKYLSEINKLGSFSIFSYSLENLSKIDKVKFAQSLYGRNKDGLIFQEKGVSLGPGSFMIDVKKEEIFKEFFKKWKVKYIRKRAFVEF